MDRLKIIDFLEQHQPMPPDPAWSQDDLDIYKSVMDALDDPDTMDIRCGALLFGSLNENGCYGRAPIICEMLGAYLIADDIESIAGSALASTDDYIVCYGLEVIASFSSREDVVASQQAKRFAPILRAIANKPSEIQYPAFTALYWIVTKEDLSWLQEDRSKFLDLKDDAVVEEYDELISEAQLR